MYVQIGYAFANRLLPGGFTIDSSFVGLNFRSACAAALMPARPGRANFPARF